MSLQDTVLLDDSLEEAALEPFELFGNMPELRHYLAPARHRHDEEVGLRALLERATPPRRAVTLL